MTPKQRAMYDAIKRLTVRGVPPTYPELAKELGLKSKNQVHSLVHSLAAEGLLWVEKGHRGIRLAEPPAHVVAAISLALSNHLVTIGARDRNNVYGPWNQVLEPIVRKAWMDAL